MNDELIRFTRTALERNIPRADISASLAAAGWKTADIRSALESFAESHFALPVPRPRPYLSARDVFIYIVMFSALYHVCYNIGSVLFILIDKAWPDAAYHNAYFMTNYQNAMRWAVSGLTVSLPLFLYTFHLTNKTILANPVERNSKPRKWLTYLTLMIATLALTCDTGMLVFNLLGGELGIRFMLKTLTVAVIAGGTFAYFLNDMRKEENI